MSFSAPAFNFSCRGLFSSLKDSFLSPQRPTILIHEGTSLMMGIPPGISLDNREILALHLREMFDKNSRDWFSWIRMLSQPLRRQLGYVGRLTEIKNYLSGPLRWKIIEEELPPNKGPENQREPFAIVLADAAGHGILMTISEYALAEEMNYFIVTNFHRIENYFDRGDDDDSGEYETPTMPVLPDLVLSPR